MPASSGEVIGAALESVFGHIAHASFQANKTFENKSCIADQLIDDIEYDSHGGKKSKFVSKNQVTNLNKGLSAKNSLESLENKMSGGKKDDQLEEPKIILWSRERVKLGWQNRNVYQGAGLDNLGNTCYMNSSLQALFHIPSLLNWLLDEGSMHIQKCESNPMSSSFCSICAMIRTLKSTIDRSNNSMRPTHIHNKLKCIGKTLMYGRQEDAHEFIKLLLDHMEKSYLNLKKATKLDHRSKETTPLNQIFGGYLRQQVICPLCRYVSTTFSHFQDLVLDIRSVNSVDEALNLHFRKETLDSDNAYKCERCHKKVSATKKHLIERAPHVLLLQLKRFTISGGKIGKHINIQKTIDISRFVNGSAVTGGSLKYGHAGTCSESGHYQYKLVSMVIHIGSSQHGGHYTAVAQASNQAMYEFDDSSVRTITMQNALLSNPYILFYEMVERPKDMPGIKPVIRQSSAKTLLRQDSADGASKPLPTSHSTSCVSNGYGRAANDGIGEPASRLVTNHHGGKSPIKFTLSGKDRERNIISLNKSSTLTKGLSENRTTKISLQSSSSGVHGNKLHSLSHTTAISSATVAKKLISDKKSSSLVPYPDDSDDSEHEDTKKTMNGAISKSSGSVIIKKDKSVSPKAKSEKINGSLYDISKDKIVLNGEVKTNGKATPSPSDLHNNKCSSDGASSSSHSNNGGASSSNCSNSNSNSKVSTPFMPRAIQIQSNNKNRSSSPSSASNKSESGWVVTEASSQSAKKNDTLQNTKIILNKQIDIKERTIKDKPDLRGWTVTACKSRPELEKSHSHDSVLPISHKDEDTTSLKSKISVDSNRSEKSTKSVKKSLLSLIPCMSVASSPDPSPEFEVASEVTENSVDTSEKPSDSTDKSSKTITTSSSSTAPEVSKSDFKQDADVDSDVNQSKRFRDNDTEPSSPSKKCKPEEYVKNSCPKHENSKNYSDKDKSSHSFGKTWPGHKAKSSSGFESDKRKNYRIENDENFSMEEKKSRHKIKHKKHSSSDSSDSESGNNINHSSERNGYGSVKLHSNLKIVSWDENRTDISKSLHSSNNQNGKLNSNDNHCNGYNNINNGAKYHHNGCSKSSYSGFDGSKSTSVVDELRRAGNYGLGAKVKTWDGSKSFFDKEADVTRRDAKKRSADELYNDEFDSGRMKKVKKNYSEITAPQLNMFQKVQDSRNSSSSNGHSGSMSRSNTWNGSSNSYHHSNNGYQSQSNWNGHSNSSSYYGQNGYKYKFSKSKSWDNNKYSGNRSKFSSYKHGGKDRFRFRGRSRD